MTQDFFKILFSYNFFKVFVYFIFVFSGSLKWIPFPYDLTIITLFFLFFVLLIEIKEFIPFQKDQNVIIKLILILNFLFLISNFYTISTDYAYNKNFSMVLNIFTVVYPIIAFKNSIFKELNMLLLIIGIILIPSLLYMYYNDMFMIFHDTELLVDKVPTYLTIGIMLSTCFVFSMYFRFTFFVLVYRLSILFLLLQLGGRGPFVNLFLIILLFYLIQFKNLKVNFKTFFYFLVLLPLSLFFMGGFIESLFENISFERFNVFSAINEDKSFIIRQEYIIKGLESISKNVYFGKGIGSSGLILLGEDSIAYPHNLFIESMMEIGFFAGFIYLFIYIKLFKNNFIFCRKSKSLLILFIVSFLFFLEDNKSNSFDSWRISIIWIMFFLSEKRFYILRNNK